jgi:hypothetical protein
MSVYPFGGICSTIPKVGKAGGGRNRKVMNSSSWWIHTQAELDVRKGGMDGLYERIRENAFYMWEQAGCPEGRAEEFWEQAERVERGKSPGLIMPAETDAELDPAKFAGF